MKRIGTVLAAAFGVLFAANSGPAAEPTTTTPACPMAVAGTTTEVVTMSSAPARRGLIARLRSRRSMETTTVVMSPTMTTPSTMSPPMTVVPATGTVVTEGATTTMVMSEQPARRGLFPRLRARRMGTTMTTPVVMEPAPMPMPMSSTTPMPTPVVPASGTVIEGESVVVPATYTEPVRRGLFYRMRMRR